VSTFDDMALVQLKQQLDLKGELVSYTPLGGSARNVKALVNRSPREPLPGVPHTQGKYATVTVINAGPSLSATMDGYGAIESSAVDTGGDKITMPEHKGGAASVDWQIKSRLSQTSTGVTLEVR